MLLRAFTHRSSTARRASLNRSFSCPFSYLKSPPFSCASPARPATWELVRDIFREYAQSLAIDPCFKALTKSWPPCPATMPRHAAHCCWPRWKGAIAGCCALRPLDTSDYPNAAEMKRLYVRKAFRFGLGRELAEAMLDCACQVWLTPACCWTHWTTWNPPARCMPTWGLRKSPHYQSPIAGAHYLKVEID